MEIRKLTEDEKQSIRNAFEARGYDVSFSEEYIVVKKGNRIINEPVSEYIKLMDLAAKI